MTEPRVSVVMPVYNARRFVAEAVESVLAQTLGEFEFLIVDDGSTDGSREIVERFATADPRIRLQYQAHAGIACAVNSGLMRATAPYLARMDADDVCRPMRLEKQLDFMTRQAECVAVGSFAEVIDADGWPIRTWRRPLAHEAIDDLHLSGFGGAIIGPSAMMRTEALRAIGGDRREAGYAEDFDMFLRLAEVGRLANIPEILFRYRLHHGSATHVRQEIHREQAEWCLLEARRRRGLPPLPNRRKQRPRSAVRVEAAIVIRSAAALHFGTAAKHLLLGVAAWAKNFNFPPRSARWLRKKGVNTS